MKIEFIHIVIYGLIFDQLKMLLIMKGILGMPLQKKKRNYIIALVVIMVLLLILFMQDNGIELLELCLTPMAILANMMIFREGFLKKIGMNIVAYSFLLFMDMFCLTIISLVFNINYYLVMDKPSVNYVVNGVSLLGVAFFFLVMKRRGKARRTIQLSNVEWFILLLIILSATFSLSAFQFMNSNFVPNQFRGRTSVIIIITSVINLLTIILMVLVMESRDNYKTLLHFNKKIIEAQQKYYLFAQAKQQEIRGIRHEINNHLSCIYGLYRTNKLDTMADYINQLMAQAESELTDLFHTGDKIVDTILNEAQSRCHQDGIRIQLQGLFPEKMNITQMDLCTIFANAVSNSVEACQKIKKRPGDRCNIHITISSFKDDLYIDIINPIANMVTITDKNPKTTKKDKTLHGFGTKNMRQIVEKYHGDIQFTSEKESFSVHINMKNK